MTENEFELETKEHINHVRRLLFIVVGQLLERAHNHDKSKLENPEKEVFLKFTPELKKMDYGSDEYKEYLKQMKLGLEHHYANNQHHPEHYKNGIEDMNLIDLLEMICDWKAATLRMKNGGDIKSSIEKNTERFGLSPQLVQILKNTVEVIEKNG